MKRLLLAAGLALACHGALFATGPSRLGNRGDREPGPPRAVTVTLEYKQVPNGEAKPAEKRPEILPKKSSNSVKEVQGEPSGRKQAPKPPSMKVQSSVQKRPKPKEHPTVTKPKRERDRSLHPKTETPAAEIPETASLPKPDASPEEIQFAEMDEREDAMAVPQMETAQAERRGAAPPEQIASAPPVATFREAHPLYLKNPAPDYPRAARRRGYEGTVILEVLVDTRGRVGALRLLESSGHKILDRAASMSVKDWVFEPGRSGEEKVEMWVKIPVRFEIK